MQNERRQEWREWSNYVLEELKQINVHLAKLREQVTQNQVEIGKLQVKSGIVGGLTGAISGVISSLLHPK